MQNLVRAGSSPPTTCGNSLSSAIISPNARVLSGRLIYSRSKLFGSPLKPSKALKRLQRSTKRGLCRSEFAQDAPFVIAIGACIFSSLALVKQDDEKVEHSRNAALGEDDVRNGAMTVISFIPLFNWLGWVFAWLDTNEQRYLVYASVYLAPYVRTGFSFSSDENWLLLLSYLACIAHVQVEISAQTGGIELGNTFLKDGLKQLQKKVRSQVLGDRSRRFQESVLPEKEVPNPSAEEEFSQRELSEFDKKLSGLKKLGEDEEQPIVEGSEHAGREKSSTQNTENSDS